MNTSTVEQITRGTCQARAQSAKGKEVDNIDSDEDESESDDEEEEIENFNIEQSNNFVSALQK